MTETLQQAIDRLRIIFDNRGEDLIDVINAATGFSMAMTVIEEMVKRLGVAGEALRLIRNKATTCNQMAFQQQRFSDACYAFSPVEANANKALAATDLSKPLEEGA